MRTVIYFVAGLGTFAWAIPLAIIVAILLRFGGVFGLLMSVILRGNPPYGRIAIMITGVLFSVAAPIWLLIRRRSRWALSRAFLSMAIALVFIYVPAVISVVQNSP